MVRIVLLLAVAVCAFAQPPRTARVEGVVLADANSLPLRRVQVILRPLEAGKAAIATQTDDRGAFQLRDIEPGAYQLSAQRDGYLTTTSFRRGAVRMPPRFTLSRGESITGVVFSLRPWAVLSGKVRFEDGDPAISVPVVLYRQYHLRGRRGFTPVADTRTNDRGEYRIHGLAPGAYFAAVTLEGDATGPAIQDQPRIDLNGREVPVPSYTTTFFPNTQKLSEASPIRLREGDDLAGIDLYLRPVERVELAGRITDGIAGTTLTAATITLERLDSGDSGTLPVPINLTFDRDKRFHIPNVAPGTYQLFVNAGFENKPLTGRSILQVTNANIEDLEIVAIPARPGQGEIALAQGTDRLPRDFQPRLVLEPRGERGGVVIPQARMGDPFDVALVPGETYDVFIENLPDAFYISEVRVSGSDMRSAGLSAAMAGSLPFQVVLESRGGHITGAVTRAAAPWPGATVALIPDPPRGRLQYFKQTLATQYAEFNFDGIAPGRYTLTAWLDEPPCDIYDEENLDACRATGMIVNVPQRSRQEIVLQVKGLNGR